MSSEDSMMQEGPGKPRLALFGRAMGAAVLGGVMLLAAVIAGRLVPGNVGWAVHYGGMVLAGIVLITAFCMYLTARSRQRAVEKMMAGPLIANWVYSPQQWREHIAGDRKRLRRFAREFGVVAAIGGALFGGMACYLSNARGLELALGVISCAGGFFLVGYATGAIHQAFDLQLIREQERTGGRVLIGTTGLYMAGIYTPWWPRLAGGFCTAVTYEPLPAPVLHLVFRVPTAGQTYFNNIYVPVPAGQEATAQEVVLKVRQVVGLNRVESTQGGR